MKIITNNRTREILEWCDLTAAEQAEFADYRNEDDGASYVRYRGEVYDLGEFMRCPPDTFEFAGWEGYHADSYFSAIVCRFADYGQSVIMGLAYS